jgi:MFS family permease
MHIPPAEEDLRYPGWRVALASSTCVFVSFASLLVYTFGVFLKPLTTEFGWSRQAVSTAFSIAALAVAACSPGIGLLLDRFPARRIVLPALTIFGAAFASLSLLTGRLWHLYAVFLVLGIVGNGTAQLAYTRTISTWFTRKRGTAFATLLAGGALGAMILPPIAQALIHSAGWRGAYAMLGGAVLLIGLPSGWLVRERVDGQRNVSLESCGMPVAVAIASYPFWILVTVLFLSSIGQNGSIAHMAALLTDRGIPATQAAFAVSVLGAATLAGRLIAGWLIDRFFAPRVAFALLSTAAIGTLLLSSAHSVGAGVAAAGLIGLGMGGEADVTPYLLTRYFGLRSFSTLYGLTWTAYAIAGALGPVMMGKAFDLTGSYQTLLAVLAVSTMLAAGLMLFLPRYSSTPPTDESGRFREPNARGQRTDPGSR